MRCVRRRHGCVMLTPCSDLSAAGWIVASARPWQQLVGFGPAGFPVYARLRFLPDPECPTPRSSGQPTTPGASPTTSTRIGPGSEPTSRPSTGFWVIHVSTSSLRFGRARIALPDDAVVDSDDLSTVWKQPIYKTPQRLDAGGPRIRISGTMEYGRLKIRHKAH